MDDAGVRCSLYLIPRLERYNSGRFSGRRILDDSCGRPWWDEGESGSIRDSGGEARKRGWQTLRDARIQRARGSDHGFSERDERESDGGIVWDRRTRGAESRACDEFSVDCGWRIAGGASGSEPRAFVEI